MLVKELNAYRDIKEVLYVSRDTFKIRKYETSFKVKRKGLDEVQPKTNINIDYKLLTKNSVKKYKSVRLDSVYRSKRSIIDIIDNNYDDFKTFITLTFKDDIKDTKIAYEFYRTFIRQWQRLLKSQSRVLKVLGVIEYQKTGKIHYHLLTNLENGLDIMPRKKKLIRSKGKSKWREFYDVKFWNYGFSTSDSIDFINDKNHLTNYLLKYLIKDIERLSINSHRYIATRNFERTKKYYIDELYKHSESFSFNYDFINYYYKTFNEYSYKTDTVCRSLVYNEKQYEIKQFNSKHIHALEQILIRLGKAVRLT